MKGKNSGVRAIGFRCFPDEFAFVVLSGTQSSPQIVAFNHHSFPKGLKRGASLAWLRKQITEICNQHEPSRASLKAVEPMTRLKSLPRSEVEGVTKETVYSTTGVECVPRIKSQLKRDIAGFTQPARYLEHVLSARHLETLNKPIYVDATLAAMSELPEE